MGSWIGEPALTFGEQILWRRLANRQQGPYRSMGGRLFVTDRRVIFLPNRVDKVTGGQSWSRDLTDIARVEVEPRHYGIPFVTKDVGLRRRLRVEGRDGTIEIFLVNRVKHAVARLEAAIAPTDTGGRRGRRSQQ